MNLEHLVQKERKLLTTAIVAEGHRENWRIKKNHCNWLKYLKCKSVFVHTDSLKIAIGNCYGTNLLLWKLIKVQNQAVILSCMNCEYIQGKIADEEAYSLLYNFFLFWVNLKLTENIKYSTNYIISSGHLKVSYQPDALSPLNTEYLK